MNRTRLAFVTGTLCLFATLSLSGCQAQRAMQQQVDALQAGNADLGKRLQSLETRLRPIEEDNAKMKAILGQLTGVIKEQQAVIDKLNAPKAAPKAPEKKAAAPKKPVAKAKAKKR